MSGTFSRIDFQFISLSPANSCSILSSTATDNIIRIHDTKKTCIELGKDYAYKTTSNRAGTRLIAISSANLILRLWDLEKQKEITALKKTTHPLIGFTSVVWGPQEATPLLVSTRNNGIIQLWNVKDNEQNLAKAWQGA